MEAVGEVESKERVDRFVDVQVLLNAGISVAALNYRFVDQAIQENVRTASKSTPT